MSARRPLELGDRDDIAVHVQQLLDGDDDGVAEAASGERSVQVLECFGGASFDVGVPVGRGGGRALW